MKIEKFNSNRMLLYIKGFVSFILVCLIVIFGIDVVSQTEKEMSNKITIEQKQNKAQSSDEVERLLQILRKDENKEKSPQLIVETIQKLGSIGDERAIPELVRYLDYERKIESAQSQDQNLKIDPVETTHWDYLPLSGRYPAIGALFQIGKSSLPELVKVIENEKTKSQKSQNALETVQLIFRDDLSEGIKYLENAMNSSAAQEGKQRLLTAIEKTKTKRQMPKE
jgi:hypothetical protein